MARGEMGQRTDAQTVSMWCPTKVDREKRTKRIHLRVQLCR